MLKMLLILMASQPPACRYDGSGGDCELLVRAGIIRKKNELLHIYSAIVS